MMKKDRKSTVEDDGEDREYLTPLKFADNYERVKPPKIYDDKDNLLFM